MAWAFRFSKTNHGRAEELGLIERENVPRLLSLFEYYAVPVTWATVGHLFLESCKKGANIRPHADMPRPEYFENSNWNFAVGDWYDSDPCSDFKKAPAWYAPDLIDLITQSPVGHEIGCHTFSHIDCNDKYCSTELLKAELEASIKVASVRNIRLSSMVFPGGTLGNYSILKEMGFTCYRKIMKYNVDIPALDQYGLVQIPSSHTLLRSYFSWPAKRYIRMAKSYIKKASNHKMVAHLWFHPSMDPWFIENVLPEILAFIRKMADAGKVEILTMKQLSDKFINNTSKIA